MPDTWIKLRDDLDSDPRVARMAAMLATTAVNYVLPAEVRDLFATVTRAVTRNAMRDITLAGLTRVWSHACRHTTDGIFQHVDLTYLDDLARIPGFGVAMQTVGWAVHHPESDSIILPNFTEHNAPDKNGARAQTANARRQARYREAQKAKAAAQASPPPVNDVNPVNTVTSDRPEVTSRVTQREKENNVTSSLSSSSSISEDSEREGESRGETAPKVYSTGVSQQFQILEASKARINRLRGSWAKLPHWSSEEEHALTDNLHNLTAMEDQDWCIIAFYLRWAHSSANTQSKDPVRVTSRRHSFVSELPAMLDRAVTHWKQNGCPRLNPDGTKASATTPKVPKPEPPPVITAGSANFTAALKAFGADLPPKPAAVATKPAAA